MKIQPSQIPTLAFSILMIIVSISMAWWLQNETMIGNQVERWPKAQGALTPSKKPGQISYKYFANSKSYEGHRRKAGWNENADLQFLQTHQPGAQLDVYYNPKDPGVSALEPGSDITNLLFYSSVCWILTVLLVAGNIRMLK